jgi:hypothetical protein
VAPGPGGLGESSGDRELGNRQTASIPSRGRMCSSTLTRGDARKRLVLQGCTSRPREDARGRNPPRRVDGFTAAAERRYALPISDRGSELGKLHDVVATQVEWHGADAWEVETESALAEPGRDNINESDLGPGELGEQTTRKWRAAGVDDKEPTAGHDQRAIATIRRVDTFAYLARWTLRSLGRRGERKDSNYDFPLAQPVTHRLENLRPLLGVPRL